MLSKLNKKKAIYVLSCLSIFLLIYVLNHFTLYTSDDFVYHFIYKDSMPTGNEQPISNLMDLITSQVNHWRVWNGRFTAHSIVQVFMQLHKEYFNVLNSFIFLMLIIMSDKTSSRMMKEERKSFDSIYIVSLFLMFWWFLPEIGKTVLWVSGSGNYLWTGFIDLLWLYLFINFSSSKKWSVLTIPLAFFMGAGNENTSPAVILLGGLFLFYDLIKEKKLRVIKIIELVSATIGFVLMILSPGSQKRGGGYPILPNLNNNILSLIQRSWERYSFLYVMLIVLLIIAILAKYIKKDHLLSICFLLAAHFACIFSLVASREWPPRVFFGASVLLCITIIIAAKAVFENNNEIKKMAVIVILLVVVKFAFSYKNVVKDNYTTYRIVQKQYDDIHRAIENHQTSVTLKRFPKPQHLYNAYLGTANLNDKSDAWFNQWMAVYFGIDKIESVSPEE